MDSNNYGSVIEPSNPYFVQQQPLGQKSGKKKWLIVAIVVMALMAIALFAATIIMKNNSSPVVEEEEDVRDLELLEANAIEFNISNISVPVS